MDSDREGLGSAGERVHDGQGEVEKGKDSAIIHQGRVSRVWEVGHGGRFTQSAFNSVEKLFFL